VVHTAIFSATTLCRLVERSYHFEAIKCLQLRYLECRTPYRLKPYASPKLKYALVCHTSEEQNAIYTILCVLDRPSSWYLNEGWPTRWHLLYYLLLNMFQTLIRPSSGACDYLLLCVGWLEASWCYVAGLSVGDVVSECRLTWGVLVLCSRIACWWYGIRV